VPGLDVPRRLDHLVQRVAAIDDRPVLPRFDELDDGFAEPSVRHPEWFDSPDLLLPRQGGSNRRQVCAAETEAIEVGLHSDHEARRVRHELFGLLDVVWRVIELRVARDRLGT